MKNLLILLTILGCTTSLLHSMQGQHGKPDVGFEVDGLSAETPSESEYERSGIMYKTETGQWDTLPIFKKENIVREEVGGLKINSDGSWSNTKTIEDSIENLRLTFKEQKKEREKISLETAKKVYNNRFKQNIACSPGVVTSSDKTLYNNFLVGISYYKDPEGKSTPYGTDLSVWFNRKECEINCIGVVGMLYQKMPKEVVIMSRFKQLALRIPYPFPKHIFKARGGRVIPNFSNNSDIEFMSVPIIRPCSNVSDATLFERLAGKKFIGFTQNEKVEISLADQTTVYPLIYTVVEFHKEGYVSICNPALNKVYIPNGTYTVTGSIIKVGGDNIGFVKNDGEAVYLVGNFSGNVYKLSDSFSTNSQASNSMNVKAGSGTTKRATTKNKNRTTTQRKITTQRKKNSYRK